MTVPPVRGSPAEVVPERNLAREHAVALARQYRPGFAAVSCESAEGVSIHWTRPGRAGAMVRARDWAHMAEAIRAARATWPVC